MKRTGTSGPAAVYGELRLEYCPFCPVYAVTWCRCDRGDVSEIRLEPALRHIDPVDQGGRRQPRRPACCTGARCWA